jgi:tRNA (guanine37-N1)-methyltransferase
MGQCLKECAKILSMRIDVITLFPGMFQGPFSESILKRAQEEELLQLNFHDLRQFGRGKYRQVDDEPYGGGAGMVMRVDVVVKAIEEVVEKGGEDLGLRTKDLGLRTKDLGNCPSPRSQVPGPKCIYLSPRGKTLAQEKVEELAKLPWLLLLCGHYEGIDQRVVDGGWIDEEISIGDYVLTGGELPAMVLMDAVARQIPGVLGKEESAQEESFSSVLNRKKEYPHYTRPEEFRGLSVPQILLSGHHGEIEKWRRSRLSSG